VRLISRALAIVKKGFLADPSPLTSLPDGATKNSAAHNCNAHKNNNAIIFAFFIKSLSSRNTKIIAQ
jgi:hypothetical protein